MQILKGYGAPTISTVGNIGDYYIDLENDICYKCMAVDIARDEMGYVVVDDYTVESSLYVWEATTSGSVGNVEPLLVSFSASKGSNSADTDIIDFTDATCDTSYETIKTAFDTGVPINAIGNLPSVEVNFKLIGVSDTYASFIGIDMLFDGRLNRYTLPIKMYVVCMRNTGGVTIQAVKFDKSTTILTPVT